MQNVVEINAGQETYLFTHLRYLVSQKKCGEMSK